MICGCIYLFAEFSEIIFGGNLRESLAKSQEAHCELFSYIHGPLLPRMLLLVLETPPDYTPDIAVAFLFSLESTHRPI